MVLIQNFSIYTLQFKSELSLFEGNNSAAYSYNFNVRFLKPPESV